MLVLVRQDREASDSETVYRGVSSWQSFPEKLDLLEWHGQGKCFFADISEFQNK